MIFRSPRKLTIDFEPWFKKSYKLEYIHIYEQLGGSLANGNMRLSHNGSDEALEIIEKEYTGTITIEREGENGGEGTKFEIPIFITARSFFDNYLDIEFVCIKDGSFVRDEVTNTYTDITSAITSTYKGKCDIRIETDIQGGDIKYYQNHETGYSFLPRICNSFKKQSIFAFGWEGLLIKDTIGKYDSRGNEEPKLFNVTSNEAKVEHLDSYMNTYSPSTYEQYYNPWEDKEGKYIPQDYTQYEPVNIRQTNDRGSNSLVYTPYQQLLENSTYNGKYYDATRFQTFRIVDEDIPKYKLGDVLGYTRNELFVSNLKWPYKYYLVYSNEFFCSAENCNVTDSRGMKTSFLTKLMGLEKDGSIALGSEEDPTKKTE